MKNTIYFMQRGLSHGFKKDEIIFMCCKKDFTEDFLNLINIQVQNDSFIEHDNHNFYCGFFNLSKEDIYDLVVNCKSITDLYDYKFVYGAHWMYTTNTDKAVDINEEWFNESK